MLNADLNKKFDRYRRLQKLTAVHKQARVFCAKYLRRKHGVLPTSKRYKWHKLINADFSVPLQCIRKLNRQKHGVWLDKDVDVISEEIMRNLRNLVKT